MNRFSVIERIIIRVVTALLLFLLFVVYLTPFVSPINSSFIAFIGIFSPVIILLNIFCALFWTIVWHPIALVYILGLLFGSWQIGLLIHIPISTSQRPAGQILKVMNFNAHFFTSPTHDNVVDSTLHHLDSINAGVLCLQEMATSKQDIVDKVNRGLKKYTYKFINEQVDTSSNISYYSAIYSKYRIVHKGVINYGNATNYTMYADIIYRNDTIRVVNNHLQSNNITNKDLEFISGGKTEDKNSLFKIFSIVNKLTENSKIRVEQAIELERLISDTPYQMIVCGDLNSIPTSYAYRRVRGKLTDSFLEKGFWYGYTYKGLMKLLRIDYVFHSEKFETVSYESPKIMWSDHNPVIVELRLNK